MSYTLCIIDMQDSFTTSRGLEVQRACKREIRKAMRDKANILFVEYNGYGPTLPLLTDLVKSAKYKKAFHVIKYSDGGGKEVDQFLKHRHMPRKNLRVVGVNTGYCVASTVEELAVRMKKSSLTIIADGCSCHNEHSHRYGLNRMGSYDNIKILRDKK